MPATKIADIIIPGKFNPYVIQRTMELSALVQSGIIQNSAQFNSLASAAAKTVNMPYWEDLTGDAEDLSDAAALGVNAIGTDKDIAAIHRIGKAWGANDLAANLAGDDPMRAIADLVASYWQRQIQKRLLATLKGAFLAINMVDNVSDISALVGDLACFTSSSFVDATQKLGDAKGQLSGIMMHSATEASLAKQDLIAYVTPSGTNDRIPYYMGKRVIVDDSCPVAAGTYTTYIFGQGAIALGNGSPVGFVPTETDRDSLAGEDILINRQTLIVHPRGVSRTGAIAGAGITIAECEAAVSWSRVYEAKAVRMVQFIHKLK
jgi:hypothetical protein